MGRESERSAIFKRVRDIWLPQFGAIAWPNIAFETPVNSQWAAIRLLTYPTNRASLGLGQVAFLNRNPGSLQIDIYTPSGIGTREGREAADFFENYFDSLQLICDDGEIIQFQTPTSTDLNGVQERQDGTNDNWYRRVVDCPFYRDSTMLK